MSSAPVEQGFFRERFGDLLREKQKLPLGRINLRAFCKEIPEYDYSTLRRMIAGDIRLQPEAIELMAKALDVPPESFYEYQVYQISAALSAHPELSEEVYDTVLSQAEALESAEKDQGRGPAPTTSRRGKRYFSNREEALKELKRS